MARFFPPHLDEHSSSSDERRVFSLLARGLSDEHWIWFKPTVGGRKRGWRPDFLLLVPGYGMLVVQVAAWTPDQVLQGTENWMLLRGGTETLRVPHPERQSQEIAFAVQDRLQAMLANLGGELPRVGWCVICPGMSASDLVALKRRGVPLRPEKAITKDELENSTAALSVSLDAQSEAPFSGLDTVLRERVRAVVEPQLHFLDLREMSPKAAESEAPPPVPERISVPAVEPPGFWLDRKQARMARELASPRTLVYGPAGSGKTVFLVSRAQYWLDRSPESRVLFTCYNASLASHLRSLFVERGTPPDGGRLTVRHYHDVCSMILGMENIHERSADFYAGLEPKVLQELLNREDLAAYDLILVDEGQDFTRRMIEVLLRLSASGGEITVVCDPAQDIYGRWSEDTLAPLGPPAVEHLVDCYRNTAPIFALALAVMPPDVRSALGLSRLELTRPEDLGRTGPVPEVPALGSLDDLANFIEGIAGEFKSEGRPLSELAILYPDRHSIPDFGKLLLRSGWQAAADSRFLEEDVEDPSTEPSVGTLHPQSDRDDLPPSTRPHFAEALEAELVNRGVPAEWVARSFAAKAAYDISKDRLTICTIHSAKGMDYHTVVLLGAETLQPKQGRDGRRAESLLFTGITRARERLAVPFFQSTGWVPELESRLREIESDASHQPPE